MCESRSPLTLNTGRLLEEEPAMSTAVALAEGDTFFPAAERCEVALSRLGMETSALRSTSMKSLPVRPTKVTSEEPSPYTSRLTGMVPPCMPK